MSSQYCKTSLLLVILTLIAKSEVAEFDVSKDSDMSDFCRVDQVEKDRILLLLVWLYAPSVLVTFDTETEKR